MKPRLPAAPLTDEDQGILSWLNCLRFMKYDLKPMQGLFSFYGSADSRDADTIALCGNSRICFVLEGPPHWYWHFGALARGRTAQHKLHQVDPMGSYLSYFA